MDSADERWGCNAVRVWRHMPRGQLAHYISSITVINRDGEARDHIHALPDGRATLLFCVCGDSRLTATGAFAHANGRLHVLGAATKAYSKNIQQTPLSIVVRFKTAGAYRFLRAPMHTLANEDVELSDLWGTPGRTLTDALTSATSTATRLNILETFLFEQLERSRYRELRCVRLVTAALASVQPFRSQELRPAPTDDEICPAASSRHIRRLFNDVVGVPPRTLMRIERFNYAVRLARDPECPPWREIASTAGYYDQAHMIADFNQFADITPLRFLTALKSGLPHLSGIWFKSRSPR